MSLPVRIVHHTRQRCALCGADRIVPETRVIVGGEAFCVPCERAILDAPNVELTPRSARICKPPQGSGGLPMSRPRLSYAAMARVGAKAIGFVCEDGPDGRKGKLCETCARGVAALRALEALVERAERIAAAVPVTTDLLESGEHINFDEWDAIVRSLGAGYKPPDEGGATA